MLSLAWDGDTGMIAGMRMWVVGLLLLEGILSVVWGEILPGAVAVLFNAAVPESRKLAEEYRAAREIPVENMIGLDMPVTADISREDYEKWILTPLRHEFESRAWWKRQTETGGVLVPVMNRIQVLVTMRGVPLRIMPKPKPPEKAAAPGAAPPAPVANPIAVRDEAAVDSELALFGVEGLPMEGVLQNKFYKSERTFSEARLPYMVLTARIDAPTMATCERMIRDTLEVEKTGLWGRAYVDIANKFPQGDEWLETVVKADLASSIPTVVDRFNDTLPKNYPMTEAALYYGWYDYQVSGPFLNSRFQFRKGAVAMHLHSFSAEQLTDSTKNWSAPLLERGAAVTIGNVYEPYLHLTHDFGILQQRLLDGFTWVEACWMAMPVASWQAVVLGDPLYRPYQHLDGGGVKQEGDLEFRALRAAAAEWKNNPLEREKQLEKAAERMKSGTLAEAAGLDLIERKDPEGAARCFRRAKWFFVKMEDKLRQDLELVALDRAANRKDVAVRGLRDAQTAYGDLPEAESLKGWLDILDPPPPPPADPTKPPVIKKP